MRVAIVPSAEESRGWGPNSRSHSLSVHFRLGLGQRRQRRQRPLVGGFLTNTCGCHQTAAQTSQASRAPRLAWSCPVLTSNTQITSNISPPVLCAWRFQSEEWVVFNISPAGDSPPSLPPPPRSPRTITSGIMVGISIGCSVSSGGHKVLSYLAWPLHSK